MSDESPNKVWGVLSPVLAEETVMFRTEKTIKFELEFFSERPKTPGVGGDPDNWPSSYMVFGGNVNGGDSVLLEHVVDGVIQ